MKIFSKKVKYKLLKYNYLNNAYFMDNKWIINLDK